jgi:hypothetical protein
VEKKAARKKVKSQNPKVRSKARLVLADKVKRSRTRVRAERKEKALNPNQMKERSRRIRRRASLKV